MLFEAIPRNLMKTRTTPDWQSVARLLSDLRFLRMVVGLMNIAHALKVAEQRLQTHDISFVERGPIVSDLLQVLRHDVKGSIFLALEKSLRQEGGRCTFRSITLTKGGSVLESLKKIRAALVDEIEKRLFNREILDKLGWLDVNEWPQEDNVTSHGKADLEAIFEHWKRRFSQLTWETICTEFEQIKVIFRPPETPEFQAFLEFHCVPDRPIPSVPYSPSSFFGSDTI